MNPHTYYTHTHTHIHRLGRPFVMGGRELYIYPVQLNTDRGAYPTNSTFLISFLLSSDAGIFVAKRRPSVRVGAKMRKNVCATRTCLHFCMPPLVVGYPGSRSLTDPPNMDLMDAKWCETGREVARQGAGQFHTYQSSAVTRIGWVIQKSFFPSPPLSSQD